MFVNYLAEQLIIIASVSESRCVEGHLSICHTSFNGIILVVERVLTLTTRCLCKACTELVRRMGWTCNRNA